MQIDDDIKTKDKKPVGRFASERSIRISYTEHFNLDDWKDLADYLNLINGGKLFKFNDSRKIPCETIGKPLRGRSK